MPPQRGDRVPVKVHGDIFHGRGCIRRILASAGRKVSEAVSGEIFSVDAGRCIPDVPIYRIGDVRGQSIRRPIDLMYPTHPPGSAGGIPDTVLRTFFKL